MVLEGCAVMNYWIFLYGRELALRKEKLSISTKNMQWNSMLLAKHQGHGVISYTSSTTNDELKLFMTKILRTISIETFPAKHFSITVLFTQCE